MKDPKTLDKDQTHHSTRKENYGQLVNTVQNTRTTKTGLESNPTAIYIAKQALKAEKTLKIQT